MNEPDAGDRDTTDELPTRSTTVLGQPRPVLDAAPAARLVVLHGARLGERHPLHEVSTIGRAEGLTVVLSDPSISRRHAVIHALGANGHEIEDLRSANGTFVNGQPVHGRASLRFGDRVQLGRIVTLFAHVDPLEEQILHRQKLEAIGRLGAGMAHDVNNLLGGVLSNADYLLGLDRSRTLGDAEVAASLDDLRASALQAAEFTRRILSLARKGSGEHTQVDFSLVVDDTIAIARRSIDRSVAIESRVTTNVHVRGERVLLQQMLMNLILNARDAMPRGGTIEVELRLAGAGEVDEERVALAASHALVVVRDTGLGMTEEIRSRLFEPFFTTKESAGGTGLGLSMVSDVVASHGGSVDCSSTPGKGSEFRIVLPALVAAGRSERATPSTGTLRPVAKSHRKAAILVVDDEPLSRRGVVRLLERDGHRVMAAEDGTEAIIMFERDPGAVEIALLDLDLPGMDGQALQTHLRARSRTLRIIFLSGFVADKRRTELLAAGAIAVLQKPCEVATLRATIAAALDAIVPTHG